MLAPAERNLPHGTLPRLHSVQPSTRCARRRILQTQRRIPSPKEPGFTGIASKQLDLQGLFVKVPGPSRKRDSLSPISTVHRNGLGFQPGPLFVSAESIEKHDKASSAARALRLFAAEWKALHPFPRSLLRGHESSPIRFAFVLRLSLQRLRQESQRLPQAARLSLQQVGSTVQSVSPKNRSNEIRIFCR